jgi:nicotinate-nucleotide adenylyltransferase
MLSPLRTQIWTCLVLTLALLPSASNAAPFDLNKDAHWCLERLFAKGPLLDSSSDFEPMNDLFSPEAIRQTLGAIRPALRVNPGETLNAHQRYELIRHVPIERVTAAPGHRYLRNPKQLASLKTYIQTSKGGDFSHDPLLINLIVDAKGDVQSIDLWNAHHRLVAYLEAGYHFMGELPEKNFKVLVNGTTPEGHTWPHYLSIGGIDETKKVPFQAVPPGGEIRVGTVSVDGKEPNFHLGSRNTIGKLRRNMLVRKAPEAGVFFGTFDPPHLGHIHTVKQAIKELSLDEAVMVVNPNPVHKPGASPLADRLEMLRLIVLGEPKINVYIADAGEIVNRFGRDPFFERMAQTYGTHKLFQIIGEDSYERLLKEQAIDLKTNRNYVVITRPGERLPGSSGPTVPPGLEEKIKIIDAADPRALSSTAVRRLISEGRAPKTDVIPESVLEYIRARGLYRAP